MGSVDDVARQPMTGPRCTRYTIGNAGVPIVCRASLEYTCEAGDEGESPTVIAACSKCGARSAANCPRCLWAGMNWVEEGILKCEACSHRFWSMPAGPTTDCPDCPRAVELTVDDKGSVAGKCTGCGLMMDPVFCNRDGGCIGGKLVCGGAAICCGDCGDIPCWKGLYAERERRRW